MNIRKYQFGGFSRYYNLDNKNAKKAVNEGTKKFANAGLNVLGMIGDLFSSVFTGTPTTTTNPKTISLEMALQLKQSILKGMTWLSPLNYGTALATGHGLNAKKGEEQVAKWDPRLLLIGRLGELYAGPKAIRGVSKGVKKGIVANEFRRTVNKGIRTSPQKTSWSSYQDFRLNGFNGLQLIERSWLDKELETGDPNTMVHYDFGDHKSSFRKNNGAYVKDNKLIPGLSSKEQTNYIWWSNEGPWQHSLWMFINPELKTPTRYISTPKTKLFLRVNDYPEKTIGLNQVAPETIMDNEFVTEGPVDLSNASILLKDPLGWWSRVKYIGKTSDKLHRVIPKGTYPMYRGPRFSINSVVNSDGTINPRQAMKIQHLVVKLFPGAYKMEHRLENPKWHKNDPTTYDHTKLTAQSAWQLPTPFGFTKQDLMIAALGHDFGKMVSGEGHAQIGTDLARQVFPDLTDALYTAIAEHMGTPTTPLGLITKAADITNGRPFTYLQQYAPGLYSQYLGNTIYRVTQPNGKVRLLLPSHTEAKPREITLEPLGNNKFYTHMRIWDDVDKQVPGKINDVEKNNLFLALYETLPEEAEILFPKSGPGYYGTRGTVAGLLHLARDKRFTPGTKGTLLYLDKDGKTVRTYNGTSFIKNSQTEDVTTLNTESLSRKPIYLDGHGLLEYQDYVTALGDKFKNSGARVELPDLNAAQWNEFDKKQFVPVFLMWPGKSLRAHGQDIIRRMEQMGMDVDKTQGHLPLVGDGSIRYLITKNSELPSFIGYYKKPGTAGTYFSDSGTTIVDPTSKNSTVYSMQHERNMHGTLRLLTPEMWERYEEFLYKLFPQLGEKVTPTGKKYLVAYNSEGLEFPISPRSISKKEFRATLGEYRKYLYDNVAYSRAKADGLNVKPGDLDVLRPYFENAVDELTFPEAKIGLRDMNGYGRDYAGAAANHPNFLEELKWLLKYAPAASTPLIFKYNEKE